MSIHEIVRAWKDADYLASLSETQRAALPAHPAGGIELEAAELSAVHGAGPGGTFPASLACTIVCRSAEPLGCPTSTCTQTSKGGFTWG